MLRKLIMVYIFIAIIGMCPCSVESILILFVSGESAFKLRLFLAIEKRQAPQMALVKFVDSGIYLP